MIHETAGSLSLIASYSNWPSGPRTIPFVYSGELIRASLEGLESLQHVAAVVVFLLIDLPAHARLLQPLGVGRPAVAVFGRRVVDDRAAMQPVGIDRAGHPVHAVGPGRPHHRAVIGVADGEGFGQRELERNIRARVVAHAVGAVLAVRLAVRGQPLVHLAAVPGLVLHLPGVAGRRNFLGAARARVQMKRQQVAVGIDRVRLIKDRLAVRPASAHFGSSKPRTPASVPK